MYAAVDVQAYKCKLHVYCGAALLGESKVGGPGHLLTIDANNWLYLAATPFRDGYWRELPWHSTRLYPRIGTQSSSASPNLVLTISPRCTPRRLGPKQTFDLLLANFVALDQAASKRTTNNKANRPYPIPLLKHPDTLRNPPIPDQTQKLQRPPHQCSRTSEAHSYTRYYQPPHHWIQPLSRQRG